MFSFEPFDQCFYNGVGFDSIRRDVEQRFVLHFGSAILDNKFFVVLGRENIRFFYYDCPNDKRCSLHNVLNVDFLKELGCISLTNAKDTGNDILHFPQMSCGKIENLPQGNKKENETVKEKKEREEKKKEINKIINSFEKQFHSFPFWKDYERGIKEEKTKETIIREYTPWSEVFKLNPTETNFTDWDFGGNNTLDYINIYIRTLVKCCLLSFVFQIEDRNEAFAISPLYDHVRNKLRESEVYKLLSAKIQYVLYVPKDNYAYNTDEYTYKASKFADYLMSKNFNVVFTPNNFMGREKQTWFFNPEKELECLLVQNRKQKKNKPENNQKQKKSKPAALKNTLVSEIRTFMYSHHDIYKSKTFCYSKVFFWISLVLMLVGNFAIVLSSLGFENSFWDCYFNNFWVVFVLLGVVLLSVLFSGLENRNMVNALCPRILVAEAAAWLTIGVADDLIKSMLWIDKVAFVFSAIVVVLLLVGVLIFGESRQHSPYLSWTGNVRKTLLIMNHSLFFALSFGCAMQFFFYNNLLESSDALSTVVYKNHFGQVEKYLQKLENLEKSIYDYEEFAREYALNNVILNIINKTEFNVQGDVDKMGTDLRGTAIGYLKAQSASNGNIPLYHNALVHSIRDNVDSLNSMQCESVKIDYKQVGGDSSLFRTAIEERLSLVNFELDTITTKTKADSKKAKADSLKSEAETERESIFKKNKERLNNEFPILKMEIQKVKNHLMDDDYNSLIEWATFYGEEKGSTLEKGYLGTLIQEAKDKKCCRAIPSFSNKRFFPNLLLLHTLIVLVLAFITQLIISDKSVTEPL